MRVIPESHGPVDGDVVFADGRAWRRWERSWIEQAPERADVPLPDGLRVARDQNGEYFWYTASAERVRA